MQVSKHLRKTSQNIFVCFVCMCEVRYSYLQQSPEIQNRLPRNILHLDEVLST